MGGVMVGLLSGVMTLLFVILLAVLARRVLGVPVGWLRSVVFGLIVVGASSSSLLTYLAQHTGLVQGTRLLVNPGAAGLLAALAIAWMFVLGLAALVIFELLVPTGSVPSPIALFGRWKRQRARTRRYTRIVTIAARHGLGRFVRAGARLGRSGPGTADTAIALRRALEDAGVAFVKLGQMLSTRRDLLPATLIDELSKLQTAAEPAPWTEIEPAITAALGRPIDEVFRSVDPVPLASASVGQVHSAVLADGREVVVKVQRPSARRQITADLDIILQLARRVDRVTAWGRSIGVLGLAEGFAESLREELDYTVELDNTRAVAAGITGDTRIVVPETFPELSGPTLLVMRKLEGTAVAAATAVLDGFTAEERDDVAGAVFSSVLRQIVVTGVFHADLHPGNLLVRPDRTVGLLDFGSVGRLDRPARTALGLLLHAIDRDDPIVATGSLIELLGRPDDLDQRGLERSVGELVVRYRGGTGTAGTAGMFTTLFKLVLAHRFSVPAQVAAAFRAMGALEGTLTLISPRFDLIGAARAHGAELLGEVTSPAAIRQALESQLASLVPIIQRLPHRLDKITEDLELGRFQVAVRPLADRRDRSFVTTIVQQVMVTVLAAAATIGAVVLLTSDTGPMLVPNLRFYAFLGYVLLFIAFVLGLRVLVRTFFRTSPP